MPVVRIDWFEGRTAEQKEKLIKALYSVFRENGVPEDQLWIVINDLPKENWGIGGKLGSEF